MSAATRVAGELFFQNSLAEVVRKLRSTSHSEAEVIEQCLADTRREITSTIQNVKVTAVLKAVYFSMLGYSAAYGAFNIIEVMADKTFAYKRIGYMAACLTFTPKTEVLPLLTALLKRDMASTNYYETGFALYCMATVCTPDLARDLAADIVNLLNHPRNYVRKKAILSLYRVFFEYPESLRPTYPRLKEKLDNQSERCDNDPAVRGALVCVLCELARRNPANFMGLAVPFFTMLSTVQSNWTLIKIIKVFGYFAPLEPRLGKKLVDPITNIIQTTGAKSVRYECVLAVANGMSKVPSLTKLVAEEIKRFVADEDQNLKYLGLDAMSRLMRDNSKLLSDQRDVVLSCLEDVDPTIRHKALEVLIGLVNGRNIVLIINSMMRRCVRTPPDENWSNKVISTIISIARTDDYAFVQDFEWYTKILIDVSLVSLSTYQHGALVQHEFVTVFSRVNAVRQFGVNALCEFLSNTSLLKCDPACSTQWQVLKAAAFACGEYPYWLQDKRRTCELLLSHEVTLLRPEVQVACVTAVGKIAAYVHGPCERHRVLVNGEGDLPLPDDPVSEDELRAVILQRKPAGIRAEHSDNGSVDGTAIQISDGSGAKTKSGNTEEGDESNLLKGLHMFRCSIHPEVQERASLVYYHVCVDPEIGPALYERELLPVAPGAQDAVEAPEELCLDEPFCGHLADKLPLSDSEQDGEERPDDWDDKGEEDNVMNDYAVRLQRQLEEQRRDEVAAFYIKSTVSPHDESHVAHWQEDAGHNTTKPSSVIGSTLHVPQKTMVINRDLPRPSNYDPAAHALQRTLDEEEEVDEATKKFRNVDVTRKLSANEKLLEVVPYSIQGRLAAAPGVDVAADLGIGMPAEEAFEPVLLLKERHVQVTLTVLSCRVRKEGTHLKFVVEVTNLASSSSMYDVALVFKHDDANYTVNTVRLDTGVGENGEGPLKKSDGGADRKVADKVRNEFEEEDKGRSESLYVSKRIKGTISAQREALLKFSKNLPESLVEPLVFTLSYTREKTAVSTTLNVPLRYAYFTKAPQSVSTEDFLQSILAVNLTEAPVLTCFLSTDITDASQVVSQLQEQMRLTVVDVFRDAVSFHGVLQSRKSSLERAHVAVLLLDDENEGEKGITAAVKSNYTPLSQLLLQEIAELFAVDASQ
uniref:AP-3 complex subunit delta n=1 Tax=Trypanosoma vivax (strain Y486) TaxID=1055687 RepID=G0TVY2_TRYVY|nr:putative delta-adaptin [Trypanosoma vivax Y486]